MVSVTKKLGPLPVWGWVALGAGALGLLLIMRRRSSSASTTTITTGSVGAPFASTPAAPSTTTAPAAPTTPAAQPSAWDPFAFISGDHTIPIVWHAGFTGNDQFGLMPIHVGDYGPTTDPKTLFTIAPGLNDYVRIFQNTYNRAPRIDLWGHYEGQPGFAQGPDGFTQGRAA